MNPASVGFHCPECSKTGKQKIYAGAPRSPSRLTVTRALLGINTLVFILSITMGDGIFGEVSMDGLLVDGAAQGGFIDIQGEWWRVLTAGFLHYGLFHIGFNMFALNILGPQLEHSLGSVRFGLIYLATLIGGSFGALLISPTAFTAGASGAIFGLLGVAVVATRSVGRSIWDSGLGTILLLNFLITFGVRSISIGGHAGGFVVGLALGWLVYEGSRKIKLPRFTIEVLILLVSIVLFVAALWAATTWSSPIF